MKQNWLSSALVVFLLFASAVCLSQGAPNEDSKNANHPAAAVAEQLMSREKALSEAERRRDREHYKQMLTEGFILVGVDGKVHPMEEVLSDLPSTELAEYRPYNMQVVAVNEAAAIVTYDVIVRMVHYDDETPRYQHVSSTWVKQGDEWKLRFRQATATQ